MGTDISMGLKKGCQLAPEMTLAPFSCKIYLQAFVIGEVCLHAQLQNIFTKMIPQKESSYI